MKRKTALIMGLMSGVVIVVLAVQQKSVTHASLEIANAALAKVNLSPEWKVVDSLVDIGLTESAQKTVDSLYAKVKAAGGVATEEVKALMYVMRLGSYREEQAVVKALNRFESTTAAAKEPLRSILHSMTAEVYWRYYEENRWRFYDRTKTVNFKQDDITTWDLSKIVETTLRHYELSLQESALLQSYPLNQFNDVLQDTNQCGKRRPTLYDFLAHRAIDFFMNTETGLPQPADMFQLDKTSYFSRSDEFSSLPLATRDSLSLTFRALKVLQGLIAFHVNDGNTEALVDADLKRLAFVRGHSAVEEKDSLYLAALEWLAKRYDNDPAAAEVMCAIARAYVDKGNRYVPGSADQYQWSMKKAKELCDNAAHKFPGSYGAGLCSALASEIETKTVSLEVEEVNAPAKPCRALVQWKNIAHLWLRAISISPEAYASLCEKCNYENQDSLIVRLRALKPAAVWDCAIPDPGDFQNHRAEIKVPALELGHYVLMASADADFSYPKNGIALTTFWVSGIAYFGRSQKNGDYELYVRDRESGGPLARATVKKMQRVYDYTLREYKYTLTGTYTTDGEGRAVLPFPQTSAQNYSNTYSLDILLGKDRLLADREFYNYRAAPPEPPRLVTHFFTDRAIYRPGQTIYFKGIVLRQEGDRCSIVKGQKSEVALFDVNYQKAAHLTLTTNDYGTMSGSFTAPTGVLNGQMHIADPWGSVYFSVEEYKRPKFEVVADPVKGAFRLNEPVTITGQAKAYAGSFIDGAQVKYRVVRTTNYPFWYGWWGYWCPPSPTMEITNGTTVTNDTGAFSVTFKAIPDPTIAKSYNPTFFYQVYFDVTDMNGETRSGAGGVTVGYTALSLSVNISQQVDKNGDTAFALTAENLSGVAEPTKGTIRVFRLKGPDKPLRKRLWEKPDLFTIDKKEFAASFPGLPYADEELVMNWPREKMAVEKSFDTKTDRQLVMRELREWPQGAYVLEATAKDAFGQDVKESRYFTLFSTNEQSAPIMQCDWFAQVKDRGEPGEKAVFCIGSGEQSVPILYEVERNGGIVKKEWFTVSAGQRTVEIPIEENDRGNFSVHFTFIKNGRAYKHDETVTVPWTNKELAISFETFRDKLLPGQKEEWKIKIAGKKGDRVAAEMVAAMYDASLDAFAAHSWYFDVNPVHSALLGWDIGRQFGALQSRLYDENWNSYYSAPNLYYPTLNWFGFEASGYGYGYGSRRSRGYMEPMDSPAYSEEAKSMPMPAAVMAQKATKDEMVSGKPSLRKEKVLGAVMGRGGSAPEKPAEVDKKKAAEPDLTSVKARTNLNETAFFYPHLTTNELGEVIVSFTAPEALTKWKILGLAHTKDLCSGLITKELVTQKPLMVIPNLPRFLRENDRITLTAKITDLSDSALTGSAQLMLFDATTLTPIDTAFGNVNAIKAIAVKKGLSTVVGWEINVPEGVPAVTARIVARAGDFSDGEENTLPLVTNRMLVTETMPLPMRGKGTKKFTFDKLVSQSNKSSTLRNHKLTLEFTQNPAWYAVQALPYIMEYPYECAEQTFARYYANTIATRIANATPKIKAVFDSWKNATPDALLSNLQKNQELKSALIEETPWVIDGKNESESKKRVGLLFDLNRMSNELERARNKLEKMQVSNGGWPWFDGMPDDRFITQYIITGFGRLQNLKMVDRADNSGIAAMVRRGVQYLDERMREDYEEIMKYSADPDSNHLGSLEIQYLYARSYFQDIKIDGSNEKAFSYYKGQAIKYWLRNNRYLQGMIALALNRFGTKDLPQHIIRSLKENSFSNEEMGMYWKEMYEGYCWYEAPIEAQALYIEAFDEVAHDTASVEAMKVWLLKSKQTQNWSTTKSTAEACYALLLRGADLLENKNDVMVTLGTQTVDPKKLEGAAVEAGTGYFKTSWNKGEITPAMGTVTVTKGSAGVAWGALYWQYFEQLDKITTAATPLKLVKKLFVKRIGDRGPVLDPVSEKSALKVGDRITVRIELRVDRDIEYVHLKDMRAAGFEPVNVFSGYRWQDGLGYYESTRDLATSFFMANLNKGAYVFEYDLVVSHKGDFSNGITTIQCMYAPEFTSHSEGIRVKVGE